MHPNLGAFSRWARLLGGVGFLVLLWGQRTPWGLLGLPLIVSAVAGWCPLCAVTAGAREDRG